MSNVPKLSAGDVRRSLEGEPIHEPVFQVLAIKAVENPDKATRYRLIISDGETITQCMLSTSTKAMVEDNTVEKYDIIRIKGYSNSAVGSGRLLMIVLNMEVIQKYDQKIGDPKNADTKPASGPDVKPNLKAESKSPAKSAVSKPAASRKPLPKADGPLYPIEGLSPYQNKWTIKARVTVKSEIKYWQNARGDGKLFSVNFLDETGEIRATGFNDAVDRFYTLLVENKVYTVSKAKIVIAKKQFSNLNSEYEITLEKDTIITECDDSDVPEVQYDFVPLDKLEQIEPNQTCDVIGIVQSIDEVSSIVSKATSKTVTKRDLTLVDDSEQSVRLTLWGKTAENFQPTEQNPVMLLKGVKVGDFGGRSLSMFSSTQMVLNADLPKAHALRGWYDEEGARVTNWKSYSSMGGGAGGAVDTKSAEFITVQDVKDRRLGVENPDKGDWYTTRASIIFVRKENFSYPACPTDGCNKKVQEDAGGWRCEKCDKVYNGPVYRYIFSANCADHTGTFWASGFNDVGEQIMGISAQELHDLGESGETGRLNKAFNDATGRQWSFTIRVKEDTYQEATRLRHTIMRCSPVDWSSHAMEIATRLLK